MNALADRLRTMNGAWLEDRQGYSVRLVCAITPDGDGVRNTAVETRAPAGHVRMRFVQQQHPNWISLLLMFMMPGGRARHEWRSAMCKDPD